MTDVIGYYFNRFGFPLRTDRTVIPKDDSTLFVCSGMQQLKSRFRDQDGGTDGSLQWCVRTNDIELVGDGSHLTSFVMVGNFSFKGPPYEDSCRMWDLVLAEFDLKDDCVTHVHPSRGDHRLLWEGLGYPVVDDAECVWSDGEVGGNCCEVYYRGLEIGNLVNTMGHSTDVGFGLERLLQVVSGTPRVDETELFDQSLCPVVRDHSRTLRLMKENDVRPGNKGRDYVCRRLVRRCLRLTEHVPGCDDWVSQESELLGRRLKEARKAWRKHKDKPPEWWWDTFGILPEELKLLS